MKGGSRLHERQEEEVLLVSACLAGRPCRYDGRDNLVPSIRDLVSSGRAVCVCPETLGGLPTPRVPAEITENGRVVNRDGKDVTDAFRRGAEEALRLAAACGCRRAVLKARSPSCGRDVIYSGRFDGTLANGSGVTAQLLMKNGITVLTEEEWTEALRQKDCETGHGHLK